MIRIHQRIRSTNYMVKLKNGFIYEIIKSSFFGLNRLNLVELFKYAGRRLNPRKQDNEWCEAYERTTTDIFILLKWMFVFIIWFNNFSSGFITFLVFYLLFFNLYTYFYFHIWKDTALKTDDYTKDRIRRRFINLLLALGFSTICFAYLYQVPYVTDINWGTKIPAPLYSLLFSFSTSLAANYSDVIPKTDSGNIICNLELFTTFIFVTIVLSRSLPQTNSPK